MAITTEQIHAIAQQIADNGENPTIVKIREALGNKGSLTTIGNALKIWRDNKATQNYLANVNIPSVIEEQLKNFSALIWQNAQEAADMKFLDQRQALENQKNQADIELLNAQSLLQQLEDEKLKQSIQLETMQQNFEKLQKEVTLLQESNLSLTTQNALLQGELNGSKQLTEVLAADKKRLETKIEILEKAATITKANPTPKKAVASQKTVKKAISPSKAS